MMQNAFQSPGNEECLTQDSWLLFITVINIYKKQEDMYVFLFHSGKKHITFKLKLLSVQCTLAK